MPGSMRSPEGAGGRDLLSAFLLRQLSAGVGGRVGGVGGRGVHVVTGTSQTPELSGG